MGKRVRVVHKRKVTVHRTKKWLAHAYKSKKVHHRTRSVKYHFNKTYGTLTAGKSHKEHSKKYKRHTKVHYVVKTHRVPVVHYKTVVRRHRVVKYHKVRLHAKAKK